MIFLRIANYVLFWWTVSASLVMMDYRWLLYSLMSFVIELFILTPMKHYKVAKKENIYKDGQPPRFIRLKNGVILRYSGGKDGYYQDAYKNKYTKDFKPFTPDPVI